MGPVRAAGILWAAAVLGSQAREMRSRLPLLPHRQAHTVLAVRGGCFGAIINPCTTGSPIEFLFTYLSLHVQTKSPSVVVLWEDVSPFLSSPQPVPACPLGSTTSVPSATRPPHAGSVSMQYSMSSVGHAQLALELGIGFFFRNLCT